MSAKAPATLALYRRLSGLPLGNWLFSRAVCFQAPYFASISPVVQLLEPGRCEVGLARRRKVLNHIRTVHAIAMCNLCELAGGLACDVTVPTTLRWIPRGMNVEYLKKATTDLRAVCRIDAPEWRDGLDLPVRVDVIDRAGVLVMRADISMYISQRKSA